MKEKQKPKNDLKQKSLMDKESAKEHIELLRSLNLPHTIKVSNYTTEINSDLMNVKFVKTERSMKMFAASSKIKSDLKTKEVPTISKENLRYFQHNFKEDFFAETVYNIDLKSAYANVLFNDGFISKDTMKYISLIPKMDRLASMGMLAARKVIFQYDENAKLVSTKSEIAKTENFFWYCVKRVDEIMNELKFICYEKYIFTWVDGIYFFPDVEKLQEIEFFLRSLNYQYSFDVLKNFQVEVSASKAEIKFEKEEKVKYFQIPTQDYTFANDLLTFLGYDKKKQKLKNDLL